MTDFNIKVCGHKAHSGCRECLIDTLEAERDALQKELTRLSGKTGFCVQCEAYAKELDRYRNALEKIANHTPYWMMGQMTAKQALKDLEDA